MPTEGTLNAWPPAMQTALIHTALLQSLLGQVEHETFVLASYLSIACLASPLAVYTVTDADICHTLKLSNLDVRVSREYLVREGYFTATGVGLTLFRYALCEPRTWAQARTQVQALADALTQAPADTPAPARNSIILLPSGDVYITPTYPLKINSESNIHGLGLGEYINSASADAPEPTPTHAEEEPASGPIVLPAEHPSHPNQQAYTLSERWMRYLRAQTAARDKLQALAEMAEVWMGIPVSGASKRLLRELTNEVLADGSVRGVMAVFDVIMRGGQRTISGDKLDYLRSTCRSVEHDQRSRFQRGRPQASGAETWARVRSGGKKGASDDLA